MQVPENAGTDTPFVCPKGKTWDDEPHDLRVRATIHGVYLCQCSICGQVFQIEEIIKPRRKPNYISLQGRVTL